MELVETVGREDMAVEGLAGELGQDENLPISGMDAIGDRDVDQPESARNRDGRLASHLGQGVEPAALASGHDDHRNAGSHVLVPPNSIIYFLFRENQSSPLGFS
jgi:hypothetical protein